MAPGTEGSGKKRGGIQNQATTGDSSFDADIVTLYYRPGTTGWTDSEDYDASAGTWKGYRLAVWEDETVMVGDVTGDGKITNSDVIRLARSLLDLVMLDEAQQNAADVTGDGKISNADVIKLARYLLGLTTLD